MTSCADRIIIKTIKVCSEDRAEQARGESKGPFVCPALFLLFGKRSDQEVFMLDVAIIGCGVIGAAAAYELSHYPLQTAIFEAENVAARLTSFVIIRLSVEFTK